VLLCAHALVGPVIQRVAWELPLVGAGCVGGVAYISKTCLTSGNGGAGGNYCGRFSSTCNGPGRVKFR
jgi:hypothetical protein